MIKKLIALLIMVPVGIVVITLAVANRQPVDVSLVAGIEGQSVVLFSPPLFVLLFAMLIIGMVIGSFATWLTQGKHRKVARERKVEVTKLGFEAEKQKEKADKLEKMVVDAAAPKTESVFPALASS
jgi:uncharacterized integral membrane protein